MIEVVGALDTQLLLYLNSLHTPFGDTFMYLVSGKWIWVPMYVLLLGVIARRSWRSAAVVLLVAALAIVLADQVSSGIIKHAVERLRPTHNPAIGSLVHVVNGYRGGMYGFVSSHAANTVAFATLFSLLLRCRWVTIAVFAWSVLVMYSRIYLGVHYPGDIIGGIVVGTLCGVVCYYIYVWLADKLSFLQRPPILSHGEACIMASVVGCYTLIITIISIFMFYNI